MRDLTDKKMPNIMLYSSGITPKAAAEMEVSPSSTPVILMLKQVMGEEKIPNVNPAVKSLYKWLG